MDESLDFAIRNRTNANFAEYAEAVSRDKYLISMAGRDRYLLTFGSKQVTPESLEWGNRVKVFTDNTYDWVCEGSICTRDTRGFTLDVNEFNTSTGYFASHDI